MMTLTVAIERAMRAHSDKASEEVIKKAYAELELIMDIMVAEGISRETIDELVYSTLLERRKPYLKGEK